MEQQQQLKQNSNNTLPPNSSVQLRFSDDIQPIFRKKLQEMLGLHLKNLYCKSFSIEYTTSYIQLNNNPQQMNQLTFEACFKNPNGQIIQKNWYLGYTTPLPHTFLVQTDIFQFCQLVYRFNYNGNKLISYRKFKHDQQLTKSVQYTYSDDEQEMSYQMIYYTSKHKVICSFDQSNSNISHQAIDIITNQIISQMDSDQIELQTQQIINRFLALLVQLLRKLLSIENKQKDLQKLLNLLKEKVKIINYTIIQGIINIRNLTVHFQNIDFTHIKKIYKLYMQLIDKTQQYYRQDKLKPVFKIFLNQINEIFNRYKQLLKIE